MEVSFDWVEDDNFSEKSDDDERLEIDIESLSEGMIECVRLGYVHRLFYIL